MTSGCLNRLIVLAVVWSPLMHKVISPLESSGQLCAGTWDRPGDNPHQSRSVVIAKNGIVATSHPLAAQAGVDILKAGGNAIDAAIASNAMLGLVEPMSCGIGGDLFAIVWDSTTEKLYGLNASGRSPHTLSREVFAEKSLEEIPIHGPLSWSVPGCIDGWDMLRKRFGTQTFAQVLAPVIEYAEQGVPVPDVIAGYWKSSEGALRAWPESAATFLIDGRAPEQGELFCNPRLCESYRLIAECGRDAFYKGSIAERIVEFSRKNGGYLTARDFREHTSNWVEPVSASYRGYDVWELPPNGQGIAALQMLNLLEGYDLASTGPGSAEQIHLFVEAKKLAFADRAKFYSDPEFNALPVSELISREYADRRRALIDTRQAALKVPAGNPKLSRGDTVYITVIDKDRNCCSLIQSNYHGFGSMVTPGDVGFVLQNRGALFALEETHWNRFEPHKRPFHTIIPAMVTHGGKPWFCFGVMGGDMQPQGHVQILVNMIDFGMNVQQAGDAARVRHHGSQTPTGQPMEADGGTVLVESGISDETVARLERLGHHVERSSGSFGGYQGIRIDWDHGTLHGASEPRKDGAAVGY